MKILGLVGTRPNFIKMAPVIAALRECSGVETLLVHTGQHFDRVMSDVFFEELKLPTPNIYLGIGHLSAWAQMGRIIESLGNIIAEEKPSWVIVPGDVNSTLAGAIAAIRVECSLAHLESGLRSFDRTMPEELNRIATDHLADLLFVTEPSGLINLKNEGLPESRVRFVGNTMIDTLLDSRELAERRTIGRFLGFEVGESFIVMTMHRPATVDNIVGLKRLFEILKHATTKGKVIFPIHPRTRKRLIEFGLDESFQSLPNLWLVEPLGYLDFLALLSRARVVMTDSGGIQEETTVLGTACLTLRDNTERPITCEMGTNHLVGTDPLSVNFGLDEVWDDPPKGTIPDGWDGKAARRVADCLLTSG
jgi:UDP-N-acetylglucosamine 2-epimerase (non-hydrolysing)